MCANSELQITAVAADLFASRRAREFITASSCRRHCGAHLDDMVLLTTEVVTNAVLHGCPPITIAVESSERACRVTVSDGCPQHPRAARPSVDSQGGRGLMIIERLADGWGVEPRPGFGKAVWFEFAPG